MGCLGKTQTHDSVKHLKASMRFLFGTCLFSHRQRNEILERTSQSVALGDDAASIVHHQRNVARSKEAILWKVLFVLRNKHICSTQEVKKVNACAAQTGCKNVANEVDRLLQKAWHMRGWPVHSHRM